VAEPHVVTALRAKHAELAGEIKVAEQRLRKLWSALEHVDATLRLFAPDTMPELIRPKAFRPQADWAQRGENMRTALGVLRRANGHALTTRAVALQVMAERGLDPDGPSWYAKWRGGSATRSGACAIRGW
jgi:hypothetical protein